MKKFLLVLLTLSMLLTAIPFVVFAEGESSIPPWEDKNNYIEYDNGDGHKREGYSITKITVFMTEEFMSTHEVPARWDFGKIEGSEEYIFFGDFIREIEHEDSYEYNEFVLRMTYSFKGDYPLNERSVEAHISCLKALEQLDIVEKFQAHYVSYSEEEIGGATFNDDWTVYDNYFYYKNEDSHKEWGYSTSGIVIETTDAFIEFVQDNYTKNDFGYYYLETDIFPDIKDKIKSIRLGGYRNRVKITLENPGEEISNYTEEHIDAYVELLEYFCDHPIATSVTPNSRVVGYWGGPINPPDSEPDDTTTDTEEETTEAEETTAPETTAPETTSGDSENTAQKNHQTGDELYFLMAAAVLSFAVVTFVTTLKRRVKSK